MTFAAIVKVGAIDHHRPTGEHEHDYDHEHGKKQKYTCRDASRSDNRSSGQLPEMRNETRAAEREETRNVQRRTLNIEHRTSNIEHRAA